METAPPGLPAVVHPAGGNAASARNTDALAAVRYRWWVVLVGVLLGLAAAGAWAHTREPVWQATTAILVHPVGRDINVVGGRTQGEVNLDTEAQLVRSTAIASEAAGRLPEGKPADLARQVSVEVPPNTSVLMITFSGGTPAAARAGSRAFAEAYLAHRERTAEAEISAQTSTIQARIKELDESLASVNERLAAAPPDSAAAVHLESQRGTITNQLTTMTTRLDELATATVTGGTVISEARIPERPSQPWPAVILASGAAAGLVLGVAGTGLVDRLARRVKRPADLPRRLGVPVLAALTGGTAPRRDDLVAPAGRGGRAIDRLRNEVVALTSRHGRASQPDRGRMIMVTGASGGPGASLTAAHLAASLARAGHQVVLVGARPGPDPGAGALGRQFGLAPAPGLAEVLSGQVPLAGALRNAPGLPELRVIMAGAPATTVGTAPAHRLRAAFDELTRQASHVVLDAPPTCASADAQSLAGHADAAVLVVVARRTRFSDVADAIDQLRRVGTALLGVVVVPPPRRERKPGRRERRELARGPAAPPETPFSVTAAPGADPAPHAGTNGRPGRTRPAPHRSPQVGQAGETDRTSGTDPRSQTIVLPRIAADERSQEPHSPQGPRDPRDEPAQPPSGAGPDSAVDERTG